MSSADKRARDRAFNAKRPAWTSFYKTSEWRAMAKAQMAREPFCRFCAKAGKRTPANIADHIERHGGNRVKFFSGALQSLCRHCHNAVKQSMERGNRAGCDASGLPVDPSHPWS